MMVTKSAQRAILKVAHAHSTQFRFSSIQLEVYESGYAPAPYCQCRFPIRPKSGNRESPIPDSAGTGNRGPDGGGPGISWSVQCPTGQPRANARAHVRAAPAVRRPWIMMFGSFNLKLLDTDPDARCKDQGKRQSRRHGHWH